MNSQPKLIDVYHGSQSESWLEVYADGRIVLHSENDGHAAWRHGIEARDTEIDMAGVAELIVRALRAHWHDVYASDLVDYGDSTAHHGRDFLLEQRAPEGCEAIVTNPPFQWAEQFVAHALELCPLVIMLLRTAFLESERRTAILEGRGLARIYTFRKRLPMMHRSGWTGPHASSAMSFSWFVWQRGYRGDAVVRRISWERAEPEAPQLRVRGRPKMGEKKADNVSFSNHGNSRAYIIARLRRDGYAQLAAQVESRILSARAAALAAGFGRYARGST